MLGLVFLAASSLLVGYALRDGIEFFKSPSDIISGILPDLFAENQGVVAAGVLKSNNVFYADEVLAKHDENYMPKEVLEDLKARGVYVEPGID